MFELLFFIFLLLILLFIVISTLLIGIAPTPSSKKVALKFQTLIATSSYETIIDLGSGFGTLAIFLARKFPDRKIIGYEISFFPWLFSLLLKYVFNLKNLELYQKDFLKLPFENALYICYLFPKGMEKINEKINQEDSHIELISSTFALRNKKVKKEVKVNDIYQTPLLWYRT